MNDTRLDKYLLLGLFVFALLVFTQGLSIHGVEYRDDEVFYFQSTAEMLDEGNYLSPTYFGEDRFQKPILFYWLILLSYKVLGVSWFSARVVAVIFAGLSVCFTFLIARRFFNARTSFLSALILMASPLFLRHAKNVVPDMPLNFFIVASVYFGIRYFDNPSHKGPIILFYLLSALGFMIKGIAALVVPLGAVLIYILCTQKKEQIGQLMFLRGMLIWILIIAPWFVYMSWVHGSGYLEYMLVEETRNRIFGQGEQNVLLIQGKRFLKHSLFYLRTILAYFLPWSIIGLVALPTFLICHGSISPKERHGLTLCAGWMALVFVIFSNMYFTISHYMLVLSTPFAVCIAYFIIEAFEDRPSLRRGMAVFNNTFLVLALGLGFFTFSFLLVFLAGYTKIWLVVFLALFAAILFIIIKRPNPLTMPVVVGLFVIFVFSQSGIMVKAGVTSHGTLQRFAETIHRQAKEDHTVGVGSHDIHEKEFQVYFDEKIIKAGHSHDGRARKQLKELFQKDKEVYCLLTQKDYNKYLPLLNSYDHELIQKEYIIRKRMDLDSRFLKALFGLDQRAVRDYLMEEVVLVKKT